MINKGTHSYCYGVQRGAANNVNIGNYCCIAEGVRFDGGFDHRTDWISTFPFSTIWSELESNILCKGDINIGHGVWIGEGAVIFSGVTIGEGAIIGLNTVVTKNVAPYSVVVGAPMKVIKKRYTDEQIEKLLNIKWWDFPIDKLRANVHMLMSDNINEFINLHTEK